MREALPGRRAGPKKTTACGCGTSHFEYTVNKVPFGRALNGYDMSFSAPVSTLELHGLEPDPTEEWTRLLKFVGFSHQDRAAMLQTVELMLRHAPELVVQTYDYLRSVPETAAILGWEEGSDEAHLAERRRFFTMWIARTVGMDTSQEFANYLFRAGKFHAGHGPRKIHTPPIYVTGSIGLVQASICSCISDAPLPLDTATAAMAGWSKYLNAQLHIMLLGYQAARDFDRGPVEVQVSFFGRLRAQIGTPTVTMHVDHTLGADDLLRKLFNYYPHIRSDVLERVWHSQEPADSRWLELTPTYQPRLGWRVLRNGRDVSYNGGFSAPLCTGDKISIFPPGR